MRAFVLALTIVCASLALPAADALPELPCRKKVDVPPDAPIPFACQESAGPATVAVAFNMTALVVRASAPGAYAECTLWTAPTARPEC